MLDRSKPVSITETYKTYSSALELKVDVRLGLKTGGLLKVFSGVTGPKSHHQLINQLQLIIAINQLSLTYLNKRWIFIFGKQLNHTCFILGKHLVWQLMEKECYPKKREMKGLSVYWMVRLLRLRVLFYPLTLKQVGIIPIPPTPARKLVDLEKLKSPK